MWYFLLSALWHCRTGDRKGCRKLDFGLCWMVTTWLELCTSYSSSCHHHLRHPFVLLYKVECLYAFTNRPYGLLHMINVLISMIPRVLWYIIHSHLPYVEKFLFDAFYKAKYKIKNYFSSLPHATKADKKRKLKISNAKLINTKSQFDFGQIRMLRTSSTSAQSDL